MPRWDPSRKVEPMEPTMVRLSRRQRLTLELIGREMAAADANRKLGTPGEVTIRADDKVNFSAVIRRLLAKADSRLKE